MMRGRRKSSRQDDKGLKAYADNLFCKTTTLSI